MVDIHLCRVRKLAAATWAFGPGLNNEGHRIHRSSSNVRPRVRQSVGHALIHFISFIHSFIHPFMHVFTYPLICYAYHIQLCSLCKHMYM